ncbi:MAG: ribosome-associated GTPase [Spirochaetes bacterium]|nr:MAG: ribosome-associated GTPase [Spirochaetota bacterium]
MKLSEFGFDEDMRRQTAASNLDGFQIGRIIEEQRNRYSLLTEAGEYDAEITGNLRFSAEESEDLPAVGDWVLASLLEHNFAVIHAVLPRKTALRRRALGTKGEAQIIAANVDGALLVQAADRDFNLNRLERYRIICAEAGVPSYVVITKTDLFPPDYAEELVRSVEARLPGAERVRPTVS